MTTPSIDEQASKALSIIKPLYDADQDYATRAIAEEQLYNHVVQALTEAHQAGIDEAVEKRNGIIREYKDEGVMFILKVEDSKTYEANMPIPKWAEVGNVTLREDTIKALQDNK